MVGDAHPTTTRLDTIVILYLDIVSIQYSDVSGD